MAIKNHSIYLLDVSTPSFPNITALIDEADLERVSEFDWRFDGKHGYIKAHVGPRSCRDTIWLHRFILEAPDDIFVDHINNDALDNRRANLRFCTNQQNQANKNPNGARRYKGVFRNSKVPHMFEARIGYQKKSLYLGLFASEVEAAKAYDVKALELYGTFAKLNFPQSLGTSRAIDIQMDMFTSLCYLNYRRPKRPYTRSAYIRQRSAEIEASRKR